MNLKNLKFINSKQFLILIMFITICFCSKAQIQNDKFHYNVEIDYLNYDKTQPSFCDSCTNLNDSLPIFIEYGFLNDSVEIVANGKVLWQKKVTSNESTGVVGIIPIDEFINVDEFMFRINNGNWILVSTNKKCCLIGIGIENRNKVVVKFYNYFPIHY